MSTLLEQVEAMLQGIIDARVREDWVELSTAINGLACSTREEALTRLRHLRADARNASNLSVERYRAQQERDKAREERDSLRGAVDHWHTKFMSERAELANVAAQRDAHLSRSVELAARVTELEAKLSFAQQEFEVLKAQASRNEAALKARASTLEARLAALTPAAVEVDGFRVGDLVRFNGEVLPLLEVFFDETVGHSFGAVECDAPYRRKSCSQLQHMVRKPVEVGDTVRIVEGGHAGCIGRVDGIVCGEARVVTDPNASLGEALWVMLPRLVAVAP